MKIGKTDIASHCQKKKTENSSFFINVWYYPYFFFFCTHLHISFSLRKINNLGDVHFLLNNYNIFLFNELNITNGHFLLRINFKFFFVNSNG